MRGLLLFVGLSTLVFVNGLSGAEPLIRVVVWDEQQPAQKQAYENFLGNAIADYLGKQPGLRVISANINQPEKGLPASLLDNTDVLVWWGHVRHNDISPEMAKDIVSRIKRGQLAFVGLHSAHWSAPFMEAMNERTRDDARRRYPDPPNGPPVKFEFIAPEGRFVPTADSIRTPAFYAMKRGAQLTVRVDLPNCVFPSYRNDGKPSTVKVLKPDHPIAKGLPASFELPQTEMYADPFHVPDADEVLFEESWAAGESFRSGLIWKLGEGRVFYFRPGHETFPIFKQELPLKVVTNAVNWLGSNVRKTEAASLLNFSERPKTIVCLGDSVTGVYYHTGGERAYPEMLEIAIRKALPNAQVKVINAGISGHTTNEGLVRLDRDVLSKKPDLVTISFGLNDMSRVPEDQFRKNLDTLVARCREAKSLVVLCTPNTVLTTSGRPIEKLQRYCDIIRTAGRELNVPVCDQFTAGETLRAKEAWSWRLTLSDEIHPNMDGHKLMAEELCRSITGQSVSLADVTPPAPLTKTLALAKEGKPLKVLAMPPFDTLIGPALKRSLPNAVVEVTPWPTAGKTLREIEAAANQTVRAIKPNLVILAVPRSAASDPDEEFARSYSWAMNWSLSFGQAEWDCLVVHPSVVAPTETSPRDDLVRRLVKAQDLHLLDRAKADDSTTELILNRWIESTVASVQKGN